MHGCLMLRGQSLLVLLIALHQQLRLACICLNVMAKFHTF
uniref:Uncharacterized protein n=1 Tax=Setaria viridis TaxID=4556 RepID=A0A4U6VKP4_SETVI|nr:hypothetical protein SEVIR_3G350350v2 [Setaria viridis]